MIRGLIFDMDGLLFDSERVVQRTWAQAGEMLGLPDMGSHIYNTLGMNYISRTEYFQKAVRPDFPMEEFSKETRKLFYEITEREGLPVKPGVRELMEYGREHGFRMGVATSSGREYAVKFLTEAGLWEYFSGAVFGDMVVKTKPDPTIYLMACEQVGVKPEEAMALEDSPNGIRSAYAAGMVPVVVPDLVTPTEEIRKLCYRECRTLLEIPALLEELNAG